jgi:NodT family efflux transporter outer membrane factor (OMF) lipoprotein
MEAIMLRLSLLYFLLIGGCTLGPDYQRPETVVDEETDFIHRSSSTSSTDLTEAWWLHFGDPVMAELVQQALENNTDLKAGAARMLQAHALLEQSHGQRLPELDYAYSGDRSQRSFNSPNGRTAFRSTTNHPSVDISYIMDLFGKLKRNEETATAFFLSSVADQQALQHIIIATVVRGRITIATLQRQLDIARGNTRNWQIAYEIADRRYRAGILGPLNVRVAHKNLARSQSVEPVLELSLKKAHHALDVLLARLPGMSEPLASTLPELPAVDPIATPLPAALLDRRPDIMQAEQLLHGATAQVGAKMAQLYPDLTLSASTGYNSNNTDNLFVSEAYVYSLIMRLVGPIYRGGQLKAQVRQAEAKVEEEAAKYAGTILKAIGEVEDALVGEQLLAEQFAALEVRLTQAQAAELLARDRYLKGVESLGTILETERARRFAQNQLTITQGQIWQNRVDLLLALGGDWTEKNVSPQRITMEESL